MCLRFVPLFTQGRARRVPNLALVDDDWRTLILEVATLRRNAPACLEINLGDEGFLPPVVDRAVRKDRYFCRAGINVASLLADGSVAACPNLPRSLVQGHVREASLVDIWNTRYEVFRDRSWMRKGRCADCDEWKNCLGNALHLYDWDKSTPGRCHFAIVRDVRARVI